VHRIFIALSFALAAFPVAASAQEYDFTFNTVALNVPPAVMSAIGPLYAICKVKGVTGAEFEGATPLVPTGGQLSATNLHVLVDVGTAKAGSYLCYMATSKNSKISITSYLASAAGKAALGSAVVLGSFVEQAGSF